MDAATTTPPTEAPEPQAPPTVGTIAPDDLNRMFELASAGDADAQAKLALNAQQHAVDGILPAAEAFACAELFARMAASRGDPEHVMTLATVLIGRYDHIGNVALDEDALPPLIEFILCARIAADAGHAGGQAALKTVTDMAAAMQIAELMWANIAAGASAATPDGAEPEKVAADAA